MSAGPGKVEVQGVAEVAGDKLFVLRFIQGWDPDWVERRLARRIHVWLTRLCESSRLRKLAWLTGWIVPGWLVWKLTG